jgi:hypothetical protein
VSGNESVFSVSGVIGLLIHLSIVYALVAWGRRIAARRGTRAWWIASYMPIAAFFSSMLGLLGTIVGLVRAFGAVSSVDASHRAQHLSDGIAVAMWATAIGLGLALSLYLASVVTFLYGSYGPGAPGADPE